MTSNGTQGKAGRSPALDWVLKLNGSISQWAASTSWWRLFLLLIVLMLASSMIGEFLHLKHGREPAAVKAAQSGKFPAVITITEKDGIKIARGVQPAADGAPAAAQQPPGSGPAGAPQSTTSAVPAAASDTLTIASSSDDDDDESAGRRIITAGGILGDLGAALLVIAFSYVVAAKVVVRKVAESDAKVRDATDAAGREAMERQLVQARLQLLQAQVEPHFLFNTLAAVDYLIETEPPRASKMQKALIAYLRGALPQMRQQSSTLGRELRLVRSYLELIKMRIEDRLDVQIAVPAALESAEFPPMMLQTLVENAVKHGIEPKPEGGRVRIAAGLQNGQLWVEVADTGVGIPDGDLFDGPTSGTGVGLQNIRERLAVLYPGRSRLLLMSNPATGTTLKITVPHRVADTQAAPAPGTVG